MFRLAIVLVAIVAAILCPTVVVGGAAEPILKLALQHADMPATTKKSIFTYPELVDPGSLGPFGVRGLEAAHYIYTWPAGETIKSPIGSIDKEWVVEGEVFRAPDESGAKRLFALGKAARIGHFSYESFPGEPRNLNLPAYGDEQIACTATHPSTGPGVMVFVRKGTVVWQMRVATSPLQFQATEAQMIAVLEKYAARQKALVGAA